MNKHLIKHGIKVFYVGTIFLIFGLTAILYQFTPDSKKDFTLPGILLVLGGVVCYTIYYFAKRKNMLQD